ncbi:MAG: Wadjet anti-phage system protein JetD domain-containing protein [Terracoccus sp.]
MSARWVTPTGIRDRVQRRFDDGTLLSAFAANAPFPAIEIPLRGPSAGDIGDDLGSVQRWVAALDAGSHDGRHYSLVRTAVGGRHIGRNVLPSRAVVDGYDQAWALLGVTRQVQAYAAELALAREEAAVREWIASKPLAALGLESELPQLISAYRWLREHRGSSLYLRQVSAPGVDTKFVERHRSVLAAVLGVPASSTGFLAGLGLAAKPEMLRLRANPSTGPFPGWSDLTVRLEELAGATPMVRTAVIVENEITFLSVPVPIDGIVLWGKGFEVDRAGSLPWLVDADVHYWGDLDTHGFAILDRLRAWLPQTRSFLMDRDTLLAHRDRWVTESAPTRAGLRHLTGEEADLFSELVSDQFADRLRLEQERIDWAWAQARLPYVHEHRG